MSRYAKDTSVSVNDSKAEIERIVERYGADGFMSAWSGDKAVVAFTMSGRQVRFVLTMPSKDAEEFHIYMRGSVRHRRDPEPARKLWEQACRQRWRALALVIKAKLEAIESDISTFDDEFLAHIVLPDNKTVGDHARERVAIAYRDGTMLPLLPDYSGKGE